MGPRLWTHKRHHHILPSHVIYGVSVLSILEKTDSVVTGPPCMTKKRWFDVPDGVTWVGVTKPIFPIPLLYPPHNEVVGGVYWFHSVRPSVRPSVCPSVCPSVRPSRMLCPLCIIYSYGWILFILGTNDHYHERVCRAPWPLTLTYIFKVIRPWPRKSCPLCSVYSSGWILSIFGTNDHYHLKVCRMLHFFQNLKISNFGKFLKFSALTLKKKIYNSQWILSIFSTNDH